jgi:hypothetical protein
VFITVFLYKVAKKISGVFYLDREETVEYILKAYDIKWCITRWQNGVVNISFETRSACRANSNLTPYKIKNFKTILLSKTEIDLAILKVTQS